MDKIEAYSYLFTDSLMGGLLITMHNSFVFYVMKVFGNYSDKLMLLFAVLGSIVAINLNWVFGYVLRYCEQTDYVISCGELYQRIKKYFNIASYLLLCVSFIPVGGAIITTLCGLFRISIIRTVILGGASYFGYYYFQLI